MGARTRIGIYQVNLETGDTERQTGDTEGPPELSTGCLLSPDFLIARCVWSDMLARIVQEGDPRKLRVAIAAPDDYAVPEAINVQGMQQKKFVGTDEILVGLWLTRMANLAPYDRIPGVNSWSSEPYSEQESEKILEYLRDPPGDPNTSLDGYPPVRGSVTG